MATCNYIPESKQIPSVMKAVIDYVSREAKTVDEDGIRYLSGVNCVGTMVFDEFMATKNLFGKRDGWCFYHYEQSFAPGEITSYREAHEIGIELAKELFPHHEVLIGTHLDAYAENGEQRVHNHFVINSVSFEDGKKLHTGPRTLETMRKISDRICAEHQLSVLPEYKQKYRPESQPSAFGNRARALTGWEDARRIFEESQRGGGRTDLVFRGFDEEIESKDSVFPHRNGFGFGAVQRSDLSFDEIRAFFLDEETVYDHEAFDEEEPYTGSLQTLREQASMGNLYAMYRLSCVYLDPNHEKYNPKLGGRYLNEAARGGHAMAQYRLGKQYFYGIYVRCDMEYAEYWLTRSAQSENTPAKTLLGQAYVEGVFLNADRKKGVDLLCEAERNGNDHAAYTLGKLYMEGKHLKKDISKAIAHLEQAAEYGNFFAEYRLAQIYLFEADCFDMQKAVYYLEVCGFLRYNTNVHLSRQISKEWNFLYGRILLK